MASKQAITNFLIPHPPPCMEKQTHNRRKRKREREKEKKHETRSVARDTHPKRQKHTHTIPTTNRKGMKKTQITHTNHPTHHTTPCFLFLFLSFFLSFVHQNSIHHPPTHPSTHLSIYTLIPMFLNPLWAATLYASARVGKLKTASTK